LLKDIATKKALDDDLRGRMHAALKEYKANFVAEHEDAKLKQGAEAAADKKETKTDTKTDTKKGPEKTAQPAGAAH
jgi:F-type H+-transporting ATPase subunit alpha